MIYLLLGEETMGMLSCSAGPWTFIHMRLKASQF
jgi:hypothetical protein